MHRKQLLFVLRQYLRKKMALHYSEFATNDIDEMFDDVTHLINFEYMQLTKGPVGYRSQHVKLAGVNIYWHHYDQRILLRELPRDDFLELGLILQMQF